MAKIITILIAVVIDLRFGDPPNQFHPVVAMGNWLSLGRRRSPRQHRFWFGLGWTAIGMGIFAGPFWVIKRLGQGRKSASRVFKPLAAAIVLKPIFAYRNLRSAAQEIDQALAENDLREARRLLSWHLVSRDTSELTESEVIGATIESLAENLTDSLAAPLFAYALGGQSAAWAYRFVNTADAMWGYRNAEFEALGKFPARLDDAFNWLPARVTGWLMVGAAKLAGADATNAAKTMRNQHAQTPSPNAGWTMSAMAGACHSTLDKRGTYTLHGGSEIITRHTLQRAVRITDWAAALVVMTASFLSIVNATLK